MPAGPPAERGELPDWLQNEAKLSEYLRGRGVSTERLGTGAAKCCADLLHELRAGACHLEAREADGAAQVLRIVEPVFIRLRWGARVLVQEAQLRPDGRTAKRKMLLAEKKEPRDGGGLFATIVRGINEELGVPQDILQQEGVLHYRQDTYHFEVEQIDSPSYPGLMSMYRTHHVQVDIQEAGLQHFAGLGLPDGTDFATTETTAVGTTTHFWKWYDIAEALACHVVKFPPPLMSSSVLLAPPADGAAAAACQGGAAVALTAEALPDEEALAERLARAGIDVEKYGVGKAKSVAQLLKELRGGESVLEWSEDTRQLRRVVEPVFLQVRWRNSVLVEVEQKFADGRTRNRNMLLAEKKSPKDADVRATAFRGIREELDLPDDFPQLDTVCRFMQEAYCCVAENMESASYPGLPCVYVTHYCGVQICETALQLFEEQGCLADTFTTTEADKTNVWRWMPVDEARGNKVKGFPATKHEDADTVSYKALESPPLDPTGLRVLLEMGAVNVSAWGEFTMASLKSLARELKTGNAHLERDGRTGRLRRVMKSSVLHLMVDEPSGSLSPGLRPVDCAPAFSLEDAREMVHYRPDLTCFEVVYPDTASYPGLPCCQQTNLVQFEGSLAGKVGRTARTACVGRDLDDGQGLPATAPEKPIDGAGSDQLRAGPRLMDEAVAAGRLREGSCEGVKSVSSISSADTGSASRGLRSVDDGHPMSPQKGSVALPLSPQRRSRGPEDGVPRRTLWGQVRSLQQNLRFKMVAKESQGAPATPAEQAVSCACDMILIRNINPLNATFQCRFTIYLEWLDKAAVGLPVGEVPEDRKKQISVPEIALQNTLATSMEVHFTPEVVNPDNGHVACKILYQALVQMELDMHLFPFDAQRLVLVLGLRARRDRERAIVCQFCGVDKQIKLDEWRMLGSFFHADRPDGRARVQFGVVIGRAYWYYVQNVLVTLAAIVTTIFAGYLLPRDQPFDRLRFGVAVLFAQCTFRLSIESKLPRVAYATAFDGFAMFCQLLTLAVILSNMVVSLAIGLVEDEAAVRLTDAAMYGLVSVAWVLGSVMWVRLISWRQRRQYAALTKLEDQDDKSTNDEATATQELSCAAQRDAESVASCLHFHGAGRTALEALQPAVSSVRAVSVATTVWLIHDVDPISATFECKFTLCMEWLDENAVGLPERAELSPELLKSLDPPELDVHNKVELVGEAGPSAYVVDSSTGRVLMSSRFHARLQLHLNLKRFPFDTQRLPIHITMPNEKDRDRAFIYRAARLAPEALRLEEWSVEGSATGTHYMEGLAHASLQICIRRRARYYVLSVLMVMAGISALVFTVFSIEVDPEGSSFTDQGKILVPLLMTLLAFKLLTASGKIPKVAYATIFDRYMLACEGFFFLTTIVCWLSTALASSSSPPVSGSAFQLHAAIVLLTGWVLFNAWIYLEVRFSPQEDAGLSQVGRADLKCQPPRFETQRRSLASSPFQAPLGGESMTSAVLLRMQIRNIHSVNTTTATFKCDFTARMVWLAPAAAGAEEGSELADEQLGEQRAPRLAVQNALTSTVRPEGGVRVLCSKTGRVACTVRVQAQVQMHVQLAQFPFDEQVLATHVMLPEPSDALRYLFLEDVDTKDAVKIAEWTVLGAFSSSGRQSQVSHAAFGVRIRRHSRYYVMHLASLCVWSSFVFTIYALDVDAFHNRGKVVVGVLLVQVVAKLAVSSKLPRIAQVTAYDSVALHGLGLVFVMGCNAAFWTVVAKMDVVDLWALRLVDWLLGAAFFAVWLLRNAQVLLGVRRALQASHGQTGHVQTDLVTGPEHNQLSEPVPEHLRDSLAALRAEEAPGAVPPALRGSTPPCGELATCCEATGVSVGVRVWILSGIDVSTASFECKFHVCLDWCDPAALGLLEGTRVSSGGSGPSVPKVQIKNAVHVILEDLSDIQVMDSSIGHVSCRIQYHVRLYNEFNLRSFPFDCQRLQVVLELQPSPGLQRFFINSFCEMDDQKTRLDGWRVVCLRMKPVDTQMPQRTSVLMVVERESRYYMTNVILIFAFLTTLAFSFYLMEADAVEKRLVDMLKIVLTQTTFRFSVEHRLPKVQYWTPFDIYVVSCQAFCVLITVSFLVSAVMSREDPGSLCDTKDFEFWVMVALASMWILWNISFLVVARRTKVGELQRSQSMLADINVDNAALELPPAATPEKPALQLAQAESSPFQCAKSTKPWEPDTSPRTCLGSEGSDPPQVVSIAFRIWLVRNVDLVNATFECKFRVFLEWLDKSAIGLPKGKKAKLPVPEIAITNAVMSQVLDRSSAPEVVNPESGHLAAQALYRATLRIEDQEVSLFPFDCQWLVITVSLREGAECNRSFMFQYCEVEGQLKLDEWEVHPQPAFSTLTKHDSPSIQDTVMCGVLIRRCSRYYVVNIMGMLCLISSLAFSIYTVDVWLFWERAEVFLGIFPLIVIFKMSAAGKLPRVGYSTKFDRFANRAQGLFLVIVLWCMTASLVSSLPTWVWYAPCPAPPYDEAVAAKVQPIETYAMGALLALWLLWNAHFAMSAWKVHALPPLGALRSAFPINLQTEGEAGEASRDRGAGCNVRGLAPRLSVIANAERLNDVRERES